MERTLGEITQGFIDLQIIINIAAWSNLNDSDNKNILLNRIKDSKTSNTKSIH